MDVSDKYKEAWTLLRKLNDENNTISSHLSRLIDYLDSVEDKVNTGEVDELEFDSGLVEPLKHWLGATSDVEQGLLQLRLENSVDDDG